LFNDAGVIVFRPTPYTMFLHSPVIKAINDLDVRQGCTEPCSGEVTIVQVSIPNTTTHNNTGNDNNFITMSLA